MKSPKLRSDGALSCGRFSTAGHYAQELTSSMLQLVRHTDRLNALVQLYGPDLAIALRQYAGITRLDVERVGDEVQRRYFEIHDPDCHVILELLTSIPDVSEAPSPSLTDFPPASPLNEVLAEVLAEFLEPPTKRNRAKNVSDQEGPPTPAKID